jgi:hypothetical protein
MKRALILIFLCVAVSIVMGCTTSAPRNVADDTVLKGVRTVYVEPTIQFYVQRAFAKELPQVHVVTNEKDADVVLYFNSRAGGVSVGDASTSPGHSTGIAMRPDGRSIVIHEGLSGDFSMNEFVSDFINAWRAANPATT